MNNVYLVESGYDYEGNEVEKIFTNSESAFIYVKKKYLKVVLKEQDVNKINFENDNKHEPDWIRIKKYVIEKSDEIFYEHNKGRGNEE